MLKKDTKKHHDQESEKNAPLPMHLGECKTSIKPYGVLLLWI
jgi:hypothetical protein